MSSIILGVGGIGASNKAGANIKTFALGSCVAVIMFHPKIHAIGMVHVALPDASINPAKAKDLVGYFANTGIPALLKLMTQTGCALNGNGLTVKLAGGAVIMDPNNTFNIGKRNLLAVKKILWSFGMGPMQVDVGGNISRTVTVFADTGRVLLSSPGRKDWEI